MSVMVQSPKIISTSPIRHKRCMSGGTFYAAPVHRRPFLFQLVCVGWSMKADIGCVVHLVSSVFCVAFFFEEGTGVVGGCCGFVGQSGYSQLQHHCPRGISFFASTNRFRTESFPGTEVLRVISSAPGGGGLIMVSNVRKPGGSLPDQPGCLCIGPEEHTPAAVHMVCNLATISNALAPALHKFGKCSVLSN